MTIDEVRKLLPKALQLARENAGLTREQASQKARIDELTLTSEWGYPLVAAGQGRRNKREGIPPE